MAAKRSFDQHDSSSDERNEKKSNSGSLFDVVKEVIAGKFLQNFSSALEPMIRRVVHEEVEHGLGLSTRTPSRSSSPGVESSRLKLSFSDGILLPIFTASKIVDLKRNPLQIILLETKGDRMIQQTSLSYPVKVEIVVLDGDFPQGDEETWTSEEFDKNIVKERAGKRPLLTGESHVTMRDGVVSLGDVEFTDNSSWIRCRKFRLGARVVQRSNGGIKIQEAISEAFTVKDHRGELYKKHHPPMLEDEVWRLEKIGKNGPFHLKLESEGINTVQQFLKLHIVEPSKLRAILCGMSEKMWEVTIKHARNCDLGRKLYVHGGPNYTIILNPICEVVKVVVDGQTYTSQYLSSLNRGYIENMVKRAYANWNSSQEVDGQLSETPLLTQGDLVDQYPNNNQTIATSFQEHALFSDQPITSLQHSAQAEPTGWVETPPFMCTPVECGVPYTFPDSPSDGEISPAIPFARRT